MSFLISAYRLMVGVGVGVRSGWTAGVLVAAIGGVPRMGAIVAVGAPGMMMGGAT